MKHFFCLIAICSFALMLPSCRQEVVAPEQQISGCYALDNNGTTDTYWEFNMGRLSIFISDESYPLADKMIWDCDEDKFEEAIHGDYSITDGVLVSSWTNFGKVEISNGKLHMDGAVYSELKGFNSEPYSVIRPSKDRLDLTYAAETVELAVNVENALPAWSLEAATTTAWISELKVDNNVLSFKTSSTVTDRSGTIELKYPHAKTVNLPVSQKPSTFIKPSSESLTFGYEASSQTLSYTIENPIAGSSLNATTLALWISDIQISDTQISFKLCENNSGADRSSSFSLSYGGAPNVIVPVTQKWSASSFTLTPTSQEAAYTGGSFSFDFAVNNPRADVNVVAASQANWITDVVLNGNKVTYKVAENNSGAQRTGRIKLTYGSYATAEFFVTQAWSASSFTLTPVSQEAAYTGGSFNFSFSVSNPHSDASVVAVSLANWITDVVLNGNKVTYKVAENNSGTQRTGRIKLTYGSYATAEFTVTQKGTPVTSLSLNKSSLALHTGNSEKLVAIVEPSDATLAWSSSNTSVATVSSDGTVTAVGNGTATITVSATDGSGKNAKCTVAVTTLVSSITLDKTSLTLHPGESSTLTPTVLPSTASNKALTWTSSDNSVATVSTSGVVTAKGNGTATITVSATDGSGKNAKCTVTVMTLVSSVSLDKTSLELYKGDSFTLSATVSPSTASNKALTWTSSDNSVATVSNSGVVTAKGNGTATITVSATDGSGKNATCKVTVSIRPPEAIDMGTVLWSESWAGGAKDKTPAEYQALSTASTVVYGGGSVTYTSANGGSTTKLYDDALVYVPGNYSGSLAKPENPYNLLISKTNGWWKIAGIPCKDVAKAKLTIHSNYGTSSYFNPSSNTTGVSFGTMSATNYNSDWGKKVYVVTYEITFSGSAETFDLTLQNTNSGNVRVTDLSIEVTEAK
jgi:uncharacterized protein YjdB